MWLSLCSDYHKLVRLGRKIKVRYPSVSLSVHNVNCTCTVFTRASAPSSLFCFALRPYTYNCVHDAVVVSLSGRYVPADNTGRITDSTAIRNVFNGQYEETPAVETYHYYIPGIIVLLPCMGCIASC